MRQQRNNFDRRKVTPNNPGLPPWVYWYDGVITGDTVRFVRSGDVTAMVLNGVPPIIRVDTGDLPIAATLDTNGLSVQYATGLPSTNVFTLTQAAPQLRTDLGGFLAPGSQTVTATPTPYFTQDWSPLVKLSQSVIVRPNTTGGTIQATNPTRWQTAPSGFTANSVTGLGDQLTVEFGVDLGLETALIYTPGAFDTWYTTGTTGAGLLGVTRPI